jgi:hypothetical protein
MHLGFERRALRVPEQMALWALHLLAAVVSSLLSSYTGALHRLAVEDAGAWLGMSAHAHAHPLAQGGVHPLPGAVDPPSPEVVVVDGLPGWKVVR